MSRTPTPIHDLLELVRTGQLAQLTRQLLTMQALINAGEKLASYIEECYPGLHVTDTFRELEKELEK